MSRFWDEDEDVNDDDNDGDESDDDEPWQDAEEDEGEDDGEDDDDVADVDESDDDDAAFDEGLFERVEAAFRSDRAKIRGLADVGDLREMRASYQAQVDDDHLPDIGRVRASDLLSLVEDRITDILARRRDDRGRR